MQEKVRKKANLFSQYYGQDEPLKSILNREKVALEQEVARLFDLNEEKGKAYQLFKSGTIKQGINHQKPAIRISIKSG